MESLRRAYGIAEPVRRGMELKIVRDGTFRPAVLGGVKGGNVHEDILVLGGRDTEMGWEDVFHGMFFFSLGSSILLFLSGCWLLEIARSGWEMAGNGNGKLLTGVYFAGDEFREPPTFHDEMEKRLKMDF